MKFFKILMVALLFFTAACADEKSDKAEVKNTTKSLVIYKQDTNEAIKGFFVEVAETREEMAKGLMGRNKLDIDSGYLFNVDLIPSDVDIAMWMKDTLIPLDMIFVDKNGKIYFIYENAEPNSTNPIMAPKRPRAVLEINGGQVDKFGIKVGDRIKADLFGNM